MLSLFKQLRKYASATFVREKKTKKKLMMTSINNNKKTTFLINTRSFTMFQTLAPGLLLITNNLSVYKFWMMKRKKHKEMLSKGKVNLNLVFCTVFHILSLPWTLSLPTSTCLHFTNRLCQMVQSTN